MDNGLIKVKIIQLKIKVKITTWKASHIGLSEFQWIQHTKSHKSITENEIHK